MPKQGQQDKKKCVHTHIQTLMLFIVLFLWTLKTSTKTFKSIQIYTTENPSENSLRTQKIRAY